MHYQKKRGLTDIDIEVVEVNKAMLRVSDKNVLLTIFEKIGLTKRHQVSDLSDIDYLITELDANPQLDHFGDVYNNIQIL